MKAVKQKSPAPGKQPESQRTDLGNPISFPSTGSTFDVVERELSAAYDSVMETKARLERVIEMYLSVKR